MDRHLRGGEEPGAKARALGAEYERGCDASPVGDTTRRDDRDIARQVDHLGHEHHRRHPAAVAGRLAILGDEDVGAGLQRSLGSSASPTVCSQVMPRSWPHDQVGGDAHVERDGRRARRRAWLRRPTR